MGSRQRPRPIKINIPVPGGWNADATESSIPKGEYIEARNMRKAKPDEWEARSGIVENFFSGGKTPVCGAEYRLDNQFVNVLIFEEAGHLSAIVFDGDRTPHLSVLISDIATAIPAGAVQYEAEAVQMNAFLIVTVYDVGVFALSPSATDLSTWNAPLDLGKSLTPSPSVDNTISPNVGVGWNRFKEEVTGDLIVNEYIVPLDNNGSNFKPLTAQGSPDPIPIRLKIGAPYKRVGGNANLIRTDLLKQFEWDSSDANKDIFLTASKGDRQHLQKRGWFYRFIVKSRYTDIKGQKFTFYHEPSVDMYVPDNDYAPPFVLWFDGIIYSRLGGLHMHTAPTFWNTSFFFNTGGNPPLTVAPSLPPAQIGGPGTPLDATTDADFVALVKKYRGYFKDNSDGGTPDTIDPFFATALVMAFQSGPQPDYFFYGEPYKTSVPASQLLSAPQTIFNWSDFGALPIGAYEIEVHRTAHIDSPDFAPSVYGQCGVIKENGTFTDDVKDTALDFNGNVDSNTGFLAGEFSAKVIRVYSNNIRLGNITDELNIRTPSNAVQAYHFIAEDPSVAHILRSDLIGADPLAADGYSKKVFGYQYVDSDDNVSDLRVIGDIDHASSTFHAVDTGIVVVLDGGVAFTFPHGYNDTIENIYVFEGHWMPAVVGNPAHREWHRVAVVPTLAQSSLLPPETDSGHLVYLGLSDAQWLASPLLVAAAPVIAHDPGSCIWSQNADMHHWPPENYELEHQFAPVTFIGNSSGPALIHTDQSVNMTDFGTQQRWEEIHDAVGCIGRFAACKVGRVEFFLSAIGMQMSEGQGLRPFPASVQTVVLKYLNESIPGVPYLTNARRASLGWLGQRNELHLRIPSSADLGTAPNNGQLPAIDIVFRMFSDYGDYSPKDVQNYRFDLYPTADPGTQAFFISSPARGRLFALSAKPSGMSLIDMDSPLLPWQGDSYLTLPFTLGLAETKKELSEILFLADADCTIEISTGMRRTDGLDDSDLLHGPLLPTCEIIPLNLQKDSLGAPIVYMQPFRHEISKLMENIGDRIPCVRIHTTKNFDTNNHLFRLKSMEVEATIAEEPDVRHS